MDPTKIIDQANSESGWVAALLVLLVVAGFSLLGYFVRQIWLDHRNLQAFVRTTLARCLADNTTAFIRLVNMLHDRPCLQEDDLDKLEAP
jgi:hypothetical protein